MSTDFEIGSFAELPLWAQVLLASRMARRTVQWLPPGTLASTQKTLLEGCDGLDRCAEAGTIVDEERRALGRVKSFQPNVYTYAAAMAVQYAVSSAESAVAAMDIAPADELCSVSVGECLACAAKSSGLNPLQVVILARSDIDQLGFTCKEARIGRYNGLGRDMLLRLTPLHPPEPGSVPPYQEPDETNGAR